jgi:hypothetical protein
MSYELRLPNINGTDKEQLAQIRSYLYQLVPQLQWALSTIDSSASQNYVASQVPRATPTESNTTFNTEVAFAELKPLIIKSADIVQAYYEKINEKLQGLYAAESDFGTFVEQTEQNIEKNSTNITQAFTDVQQIFTDIENLDFTLSETNAYIKTGKLYENNDGLPVYGLEIGQTTKADGNEVFNQFARFTPERLSFFDKNGTEIAYISNYRLYISNVEITTSFTMGGFVDTVTTDGGIVTKWVGRG